MGELRAMIDQRENELLELVETHRKTVEKKLSMAKESLELNLESMRHCEEYSSHLLNFGNSIEIASTSQAVISRISTLLFSSKIPPQDEAAPAIEFKELVDRKEFQTLLSSLCVSGLGSSLMVSPSETFLEIGSQWKGKLLPLNQEVTATVTLFDQNQRPIKGESHSRHFDVSFDPPQHIQVLSCCPYSIFHFYSFSIF